MTIDPIELTNWADIRQLWNDNPTIPTMKARLERMGMKTKPYDPRVNIELFKERSRKMNGANK